MKYDELNGLKTNWKGKVCIFGAGGTGTTWAYDLLTAAGFSIHFFCDNGKKEGVPVIDGIYTISPDTLYTYQDKVAVFVAIDNPHHQQSIKNQLEKNGVSHIFNLGYFSVQECIEDLMDRKDEALNKQFQCLLDDTDFLCKKFERMMGYPLDLENPKTFNEKLQWLKIHDHKPEYVKMVDKYEVKNYIAGKIGEEYVIPTLGVYECFDDIDFEKLPSKFVLKCTHDSGSVIVCRDKETFDKEAAKETLDSALDRNFYLLAREWPYKEVPRRIIVEEYLEKLDERGGIEDYKYFCFSGKAKILLIAQSRMDDAHETTTDFFNEKQEHIEMKSEHENAAVPPKMPQNYQKMKELAENISAGIAHVRVDFYELDGKIYFGEMTFFHQGGFVPIEPYERDLELGGFIQLGNCENTAEWR